MKTKGKYTVNTYKYLRMLGIVDKRGFLVRPLKFSDITSKKNAHFIESRYNGNSDMWHDNEGTDDFSMENLLDWGDVDKGARILSFSVEKTACQYWFDTYANYKDLCSGKNGIAISISIDYENGSQNFIEILLPNDWE